MAEKIFREISTSDWMETGTRLFGGDIRGWKFVCPNCGNVQSIADFNRQEIEDGNTKAYFSCIGRWTDGCLGEIGNKISPCNYTNGGLFNFAHVCVVGEDGNKTWVFDFRYPSQSIKEGE